MRFVAFRPNESPDYQAHFDDGCERNPNGRWRTDDGDIEDPWDIIGPVEAPARNETTEPCPTESEAAREGQESSRAPNAVSLSALKPEGDHTACKTQPSPSSDAVESKPGVGSSDAPGEGEVTHLVDVASRLYGRAQPCVSIQDASGEFPVACVQVEDMNRLREALTRFVPPGDSSPQSHYRSVPEGVPADYQSHVGDVVKNPERPLYGDCGGYPPLKELRIEELVKVDGDPFAHLDGGSVFWPIYKLDLIRPAGSEVQG